jgi:hypothetical protein
MYSEYDDLRCRFTRFHGKNARFWWLRAPTHSRLPHFAANIRGVLGERKTTLGAGALFGIAPPTTMVGHIFFLNTVALW